MDFGIWDSWDFDASSIDLDNTIDTFLKDSKAKTTKYKETSDLKRFYTFLRDQNKENVTYIVADIEKIPEVELDQILCAFFISARKFNKATNIYDGDLYQPDSLSSIRNSLQRILAERGCMYDLHTSPTFARSRKVLAARRKQLTQMGLGNKPNATRPLEDDEVETLKEKSFFGHDSPQQLQHLMWWVVTNHFGFRARDESRKLCFGDIQLKIDVDGRRYLEWDRERGSKTRTGEASCSHQRAFNPKAYETGTWKCPVATYETFVMHRPDDMKLPNSPLFLAMKQPKHIKNDGIWFYSRPCGKNNLGSFLSKGAAPLLNNSEGSSSRSKVANHSARKTSITKLLDHDVLPSAVKQLSGHKNIESLSHYHTASKQLQRNMSDILSSSTKLSSSCSGSSNISSESTINNCNVATQAIMNEAAGISSTFRGAAISNCVFNITQHFHQNKKRKYVIDDSDEE